MRSNPGRFIEPSTRTVRALLTYRAIAPSFSYPWYTRLDRVWWTFPD